MLKNLVEKKKEKLKTMDTKVMLYNTRGRQSFLPVGYSRTYTISCNDGIYLNKIPEVKYMTSLRLIDTQAWTLETDTIDLLS